MDFDVIADYYILEEEKIKTQNGQDITVRFPGPAELVRLYVVGVSFCLFSE